MGDIDFFRTQMGARFYERDVPKIAEALDRIATALEQLAQQREPEPLDMQVQCALVAEALRQLGHADAYDEHTGGGIWCVLVPEPAIADTEWQFGTADVTWCGGLVTPNGEVWGELQQQEHILTTSCSSDQRDASIVAAALNNAILQWRHARR